MNCDNQFEILKNITNDIVIELDENAKIKFVNNSFSVNTHYTFDKIENKSIFDFLHEDEIVAADNFFKTIKGSKDFQKRTIRFKKNDGEWCWFEAKIISIYNNNSHKFLISAINVSVNIETERKYKQLINNSPDLILIHDRNFILFINEKGLKLMGYDNYDEIVGSPIISIIHDDYKDFVIKRITNKNELFSTNYPVIEKFITKNNEELFVEIIALPIDYNGIEAVQIIARDITKRKKVEIKLSESELKFKHLVEQSSDGIVIIDESGNIITWNSSLFEITGLSFNEVFGKKVWDINYKLVKDFASIDKNEFIPLFNKYLDNLKNEKIIQKKNFIYDINNGTFEIKIEISAFPIHSNNNFFLGLIIRDITEFTNVKEKFNKSEELFKSVMELSPDIISIISENGNLLYNSPAALRIHGYTEEDLLGKNTFNFIHSDDQSSVTEILDKVLRNKINSYKVQYRHLNKNGTYQWMEATAINEISNPLIKGIITISRDITDRKNIEQELINSREQYKSLIENSPIPVAVHSNEEIIFANQAAIELMGGNKLEDFLGMNIWKFVDQEYHDITINRVKNIYYNQEKAPKSEAVFKTLKGDRIFIEAAGSFILFDGKPSSQVVLYDLTDRKNAEIALIENEEKFRSLVQQSGDGIIIVDENGAIIEWNYAQENITEIKGKDAIGQFIWNIQYETLPKSKKNIENKEKIKFAVLNSLKNNENRYFYNITETKLSFENKEDKYIQVAIFPINLSDRNLIGYISRDITKSKEYEEKLKVSMIIAEEANQAKSKFLANMSHEIRTPMNGILGFTEVLLEIENEPKKNEMLSLIKTSGETLLKLINDILDLSKIEAGKLSIINKDFNLTYLIENVIKSFEIVAIKKNISLKYINHNKFDGTINGDSLRLKQVLVNILNNALKFTFHGEVKLDLFTKIIDKKNIVAIFKISDTGIGVENDKLDKIFEEFYQNTTTEKYKGTGLGLSISKKIIEMMKGTISLESEVNKGSVFTITIPFELSDNIYNIEQSINNQIKDITNNIKILVAEDDITNQHLINAIARTKKWNIDIVENGKLAVEKFSQNEYDIILMDIQMPVMTGIEATISIREMEKSLDKHTPIIACTAYAMINDKSKCITAGMDEYISKPINFTELYKIIDKYQKK